MSDGEKRIAAYHRAMGDTQIIAARKTGIHEDSIGRWERAADSVYREAYEEAVQRVLTEVYSEALAVMRAELGSDEALARWRAANSLLNTSPACQCAARKSSTKIPGQCRRSCWTTATLLRTKTTI